MTTDTSAEALEESIFWLKAKYRRHGEIEDRIAAEQLEYFQAEKRHPREGVTDESKARAWNDYYSPADVYPEQERAMNKQFTANDVRRLSNRIPRSNDEIADAQEALRAFADMLEAQEKAGFVVIERGALNRMLTTRDFSELMLAAHSAQAQPPAASVPDVMDDYKEGIQQIRAVLAAQENPNG